MCKTPVLHVVAAEDTIAHIRIRQIKTILKQNAATLSKVKLLLKEAICCLLSYSHIGLKCQPCEISVVQLRNPPLL